MTETEEILVYDAMRAIWDNAAKIAALANTAGTPEAREAYKSGVYAPCVKLQLLLGSDACDRGAERHRKIAEEAAAYFSGRSGNNP